jgi:hypothetical protein
MHMHVVQNHFANLNVRLKSPAIICVRLRSPLGMTIAMPIELLELVPSQMPKGWVSPEIATKMIKMTQAKPAECLQNIHQGFHYLISVPLLHNSLPFQLFQK